jgi:opacity protein-like surface antigen
MKNSVLCLFVFVFALLEAPPYAGGEGFYYGIGGSYAWQKFNNDDLNQELAPSGFSVDFTNATGAYLKLGYDFDDSLAGEFEINYLYDFNSDKTETVPAAPWDPSGVAPGPFYSTLLHQKAHIDIGTLIVAGKLGLPMNEDIKPYIIAGPGMMYYYQNVEASPYGYFQSQTETKIGVCAKAGAGLEINVWKDFSIGIEGSYVSGFGDLDKARYINLSIGLVYRPTPEPPPAPLQKIQPELPQDHK